MYLFIIKKKVTNMSTTHTYTVMLVCVVSGTSEKHKRCNIKFTSGGAAEPNGLNLPLGVSEPRNKSVLFLFSSGVKGEETAVRKAEFDSASIT